MRSKSGSGILLVFLAGMLVSCAPTSRFMLRPISESTSKWDHGREVLTDSTSGVSVQSTVLSSASYAQFMLHFVNKGEKPVLVDPSTFFAIETNASDETYRIPANSYPILPPERQEVDAAGVAVGLLVVGVVAAALIASTASKKDNRQKSNSNRNREDCCNSCDRNDYRYRESDEETETNRQQAEQRRKQQEWLNENALRKHTLEPGTEIKGIVQFPFIADLMKFKLEIPMPGMQKGMQFNYQVTAY